MHLYHPSLRAQRRNPGLFFAALDCFAALVMTDDTGALPISGNGLC